MVVQEMGQAAASTVTEYGVSMAPQMVSEYAVAQAPTIIQEMGVAQAPTIIQEGMAQSVTVQSMSVMPEPMMTSQWETRPATIIREADTSMPPMMSGASSGAILVNEPPMPAPIVVPNESPIFVNEQQRTNATFQQGGGQYMNNMNNMNNMSNMANMNMANGPFPSNSNNINMGAFGGANDLNNVAAVAEKPHGFKKITSKFHRSGRH
jgi:hypothetical protein